MSLAVYPGSLDPPTLGHVDVAARATTPFDVVVIGIAHNAAKAGRHLLDAHGRLHLTREVIFHLSGIEMDIVPGLLVDYYTQHGVNTVTKGLRSGNDLDVELPMALLNRNLGAPETVFPPAPAAYAHILPSLVKDVAGYGRDVSALVPPAVAHALVVRLAQAPGSVAHDGVDPGFVLPGTLPSRFVGVDYTREDLPWRLAVMPEKICCAPSMSSASSSTTPDPC